MKKFQTMYEWECYKCGHEVLAKERPKEIKWTDGHVCRFKKKIEGMHESDPYDEGYPGSKRFF